MPADLNSSVNRGVPNDVEVLEAPIMSHNPPPAHSQTTWTEGVALVLDVIVGVCELLTCVLSGF